MRIVLSLPGLVGMMAVWTGCYRHPPWPMPAGNGVSTSRPLASPRHDIEGVPNFSRVSPALFRSGQPTTEGFRWLKKSGVKTVVNLRGFHSDRDELEGVGLHYHHIRFHTFHPENEDVLTFLRIVTDSRNHPILVHCKHGADRTGMMVTVYRVFVQGWALEEALVELPRFGFHSVWYNLVRYLKKLDFEELRRRLDETAPPKIEYVE
ncbi:MAG: fused DSP-PTPase phosphatase/NAD kinase-like protein [Planctomycetota bacterium]|jgi:protein tyrosine phosphatase (PTP) superfamily phosphohydrolase (DUF442 family)